MSSETNPLGLTAEELADALREEAVSLMRENRALLLRYKELVSAIRRHREKREGDGHPVLISDTELWRVIQPPTNIAGMTV